MLEIAIVLILLHTVDGREIGINSNQVTSLQPTRTDGGAKMLTEKVSCIIALTDGKFVTVVEDCEQVLRLLEDTK